MRAASLISVPHTYLYTVGVSLFSLLLVDTLANLEYQHEQQQIVSNFLLTLLSKWVL